MTRRRITKARSNSAAGSVPAPGYLESHHRMSAEDRRYRARDAMRSLEEAERIRGDAALMRDVRAHHARLAKAIGKGVRGARGPREKDQ